MSGINSSSQSTVASRVQRQAVEPRQLWETDDLSHLQNALIAVKQRIAPVWPLQDYVAVNPYVGLNGQDFLSARKSLRSVSDLELLMSPDYYRDQFKAGELTKSDIDAAVDELVADGVPGAEQIDVNQVLTFLRKPIAPTQTADGEFVKSSNPDRKLRTLSESFDQHHRSAWSRLIRDEISKHCATHYDQGQAAWSSSWQNLPLYEAWRIAVRHDRNFELLGIGGFRKLVANLPDDPQLALVGLLTQLGVPRNLWTDMLHCESLAMPGWTAWTKYQDREATQRGESNSDFAGLLAMRFAYQTALANHFSFQAQWPSSETLHSESADTANQEQQEELLRYALLKGSEIAFRRKLIVDLSKPKHGVTFEKQTERSLAQMVFCIDVRSERIRRHLEANSPAIETYGFAGFFGLPIEFVRLGEAEGSSQVPVLISPRFKVHEELHNDSSQEKEATLARRSIRRNLRKSWKGFQASAASTFAFVETVGLLYSFKLIARTLGLNSDSPSRFDGVRMTDRERLAPSLRDLDQQGVTPSQQVDLAESILRGIGIVDNFARLVVFCGHGSQTENNPLKAGLDCGACGGHSGEANSRLAAELLNQQAVRQSLAERGIQIPDDTQFVAAMHNTTTDEIQYFDVYDLPSSHQQSLNQLQLLGKSASRQASCERLLRLPGPSTEDLIRRSRDWSEVRPEWGLAGNAAFIAAPRELTQDLSLDGRAFLHSYDYRHDPNHAILEQIMTAPMVVANWINLQYYASTVDPNHFGSGNKTVHNVVGQFGILSGNSGDLMTGLPWQSIHDGTRYQHHPLRLLAVIGAPRSAIEMVIGKHANIAALLTNGWMQLIAADEGEFYRYTERQTWEELATNPTQSAALC